MQPIAKALSTLNKAWLLGSCFIQPVIAARSSPLSHINWQGWKGKQKKQKRELKGGKDKTRTNAGTLTFK